MIYEEGDDDTPIGEFTRFNNGCVSFVQSFDDILDNHNFNRIVNHVRDRIEMYSHEFENDLSRRI